MATGFARHSFRFIVSMSFGAVFSSGLGLSACNLSSEDSAVSTTTQALRPVASLESTVLNPAVKPRSDLNFAVKPRSDLNLAVKPRSDFCQQVEAKTLRTGTAMPTRLDEDTMALEASATGCNIVVRYGLITILADQVAPAGLAAMREQVVSQLCSEPPARRVMEHGGSFTSVYEDKSGEAVGQFRVGLSDCPKLGSADFVPVKS